jgi:hydroxymethylbilane synthase
VRLTIATRTSQLALWQAEHLAQALKALDSTLQVELMPLSTRGDREMRSLPEIGGKGLFTAELEAALLSRQADLAVHSLKDLPTELDPRFTLAAIPQRAQPLEALISRDHRPLQELPEGALLGTSSPRRKAQLLALRPDLRVQPLRGNVPTRIERALTPPFEGTVLALAGLSRLNLTSAISQIFSPLELLPAPAQGALAVQILAERRELAELLKPIDHPPTRRAVEAERAFLRTLGSGCSLPVAALAEGEDELRLIGRICSLDGRQVLTEERRGSQPEALGRELAEALLAQGGQLLLEAR